MARKSTGATSARSDRYLLSAHRAALSISGVGNPTFKEFLAYGWEERLRRYHADGVSAETAVLELLEEDGFFEDD